MASLEVADGGGGFAAFLLFVDHLSGARATKSALASLASILAISPSRLAASFFSRASSFALSIWPVRSSTKAPEADDRAGGRSPETGSNATAVFARSGEERRELLDDGALHLAVPARWRRSPARRAAR